MFQYGNQVGYDAGPMGYAAYNGYRLDEPPTQHVMRIVSSAPCPPPAAPSQDEDVPAVPDLPVDSPSGPQSQRLLSDIAALQDALQHQVSERGERLAGQG